MEIPNNKSGQLFSEGKRKLLSAVFFLFAQLIIMLIFPFWMDPISFIKEFSNSLFPYIVIFIYIVAFLFAGLTLLKPNGKTFALKIMTAYLLVLISLAFMGYRNGRSAEDLTCHRTDSMTSQIISGCPFGGYQ
jgi:lipopolysaccharide export LptBFGC system permease protein LptF